MPHACRALCQHEADLPHLAASPVLFQVVTTFVDHLVRAEAPRSGTDVRQFVSLHDQWVHALRSESGGMTGDRADLARLAEAVRQWRRPVELAASAPFRLCLRLEEPNIGAPGRADHWRVGYLLQAMDDQSLLVPVKAAWNGHGREAVVLNRDGFQPREYLLSALGQAATICPRIEQSLKSAAPAGYTVDARGARRIPFRTRGSARAGGLRRVSALVVVAKGANLRLAARAVVAHRRRR